MKNNSNTSIGSIFYFVFCIMTAMVGHTIHNSIFWAILNFFFCPFAIAKWLICKQLTLAVIKTTFSFFLATTPVDVTPETIDATAIQQPVSISMYVG